MGKKAGENACKSFKHSRCPQTFDYLCLSFVLKQYKWFIRHHNSNEMKHFPHQPLNQGTHLSPVHKP